MPSLNQLIKLIQAVKNADATQKTLWGGGATGLAGLAKLGQINEEHNKEKKKEHDELWKPFREGVGLVGPIETRPTADIASRIDTLKENIPKIRYGDPLITAGLKAPFIEKQENLEEELRFRKLKEALRKNNE